MDSAVAEAPIIPASTEISGGPPPDQAFKDIFNTPENAPAKPLPKKAAEKPLNAPKKAPETRSDASKPDSGVKTAKDDKAPQNRWDKLDDVTKPEEDGSEQSNQKKVDEIKGEPKESSQSTEETEEEEKAPQDKANQSRWMELKATENAAKKSQSIDDILKIPSLSEKGRESILSLKKELEDIKVKGIIPEETKAKLERLEQRFAEEELDSDPAFQRDILYPIQKSWKTLGDVAKEAGLSTTAAQALQGVISDMSEVSRSRAIRKIIATGKQIEKSEDGTSDEVPLSEEDVSTLSTLAIAAANDLHNNHWPREAEHRRNAKEIADARRGRDVEETAQERVAREEQWGKESTRIDAVLTDKLKPIFDEFPEAIEAIKDAKPSKELADQVYDAKASHALFYASKTINSLYQKLAKVEASLKAREAAKPRSGDGSAPAPKKEDSNKISFEEAFGRS